MASEAGGSAFQPYQRSMTQNSPSRPQPLAQKTVPQSPTQKVSLTKTALKELPSNALLRVPQHDESSMTDSSTALSHRSTPLRLAPMAEDEQKRAVIQRMQRMMKLPRPVTHADSTTDMSEDERTAPTSTVPQTEPLERLIQRHLWTPSSFATSDDLESVAGSERRQGLGRGNIAANVSRSSTPGIRELLQRKGTAPSGHGAPPDNRAPPDHRAPSEHYRAQEMQDVPSVVEGAIGVELGPADRLAREAAKAYDWPPSSGTDLWREHEEKIDRHGQDTNLPIYKCQRQIIKTISENQVIVIEGRTGCGKSTL
ncbi:unnamed protein product, partial [Cyprideis torosa]